MKRFASHAIVMASVVLTMMVFASSLAWAQSPNQLPGCAACPSGSNDVTLNVTFCSLGTTYNVNVTYCTMVYAIPQTGLPCTPGVGMNQYTVIKRICPFGTPLPPTDAETFKGVFCQLNPLGGDGLGMKASIPYCDETPGVYCWLVAFPQCTERIGGCIVRCGTSPCCFTSVEYCRDRASGDYRVTRLDKCTGDACAVQCTDTGCTYDPLAPCEVCP